MIDLIKDFVGRDKELCEISDWIDNNSSGFYLIVGSFGFGKSSLLSKVSRKHFENTDMIFYFIQRSHGSTVKKFISIVFEELSIIKNQRYEEEKSIEEIAEEFNDFLCLIGNSYINNNRKLLIIIDGLDESLSAESDKNTGTSILDFLPKNSCPGILFILSSRPRDEVKDYFDSIPFKANKVKKELEGLDIGSIQELYSKFLYPKQLDEYNARKLLNKTKGSPLFLEIMFKGIKEGKINIDNIDSFPSTLEKAYKRMVKEFEDSCLECELEKNKIIKLLILFAYAKEFLTAPTVSKILDYTDDVTRKCLTISREIFRVNIHKIFNSQSSLYFDENYYYIFHDSFSDFIKKEYQESKICKNVKVSIVKYSLTLSKRWNDKYENCLDNFFSDNVFDEKDNGFFAELFENSNTFLTAHELVYQTIINFDFSSHLDELVSLVPHSKSSTANLIIDCMTISAKNNPNTGKYALEQMYSVGERIQGDEKLQVYRVLIEVSFNLIKINPEYINKYLLKTCINKNEQVQIIGMLNLLRLYKLNYKEISLFILNEISNKVIRYGIPNLRNIKFFVGCSLSLFFDFCHDPDLRNQLRVLSKNIISKFLFLKPLLFLLSKSATYFIEKVPDDFNAINLTEISNFKKAIIKNDDLYEISNELIKAIDPNYLTSEQFRKLSLNLVNYKEHAYVGLFFNIAVVSRSTYGDISALETSYELWSKVKKDQCFLAQDFTFQVRLINRSYLMSNKELLPIEWIDKVEEVTINYMEELSGIYKCSKIYTVGSLLHAFPTMAQYQKSADLELLERFVDNALNKKIKYDENICNSNISLRPDMILLKMAEIELIECGSYDMYSKKIGIQTIRYFVKRYELLKEEHLNKIGVILSRAKLYFTNEIENFVNEQEENIKSKLLHYISMNMPNEDVTTCVGMKVENFNSWIWSNYELLDGSPRCWAQSFLHVLAKRESVAASTRGLVDCILEEINKG